MKHVFIQHSNITIISSFNTVKEALDRGDEVIIIMSRKIPYEFFEGRVKVYDFFELFKEDRDKAKGYDGFTIGRFIDYIGNFKRYIEHMKETVDTIVENEDFLLYTANNNQPVSEVFLDHKKCVGYYYIEEGTMSYTPWPQLYKITCSKRRKGRRFLYSLFGIKMYYHLEITKKFLGTIGISKEAFDWEEWKDEKHIITDLTSYKEVIKTKILPYDIIIVTSMSGSDAQTIIKGIDVIFEHIAKKYPEKKVAIKMHPHDFSFEREKVCEVYNYIEKQYKSYSATGLDVNYSLEAAIFLNHPVIYSVYIPSSVSVYSIIFSGNTYLLVQKGEDSFVKEYTSYHKMIADYYGGDQ